MNYNAYYYTKWTRRKAIEAVRDAEARDKLQLLRAWRVDSVPVVIVGKHWDFRFAPMETNAAVLQRCFKLMQYANGVLVRFPCTWTSCEATIFNCSVEPWVDRPLLFQVMQAQNYLGRSLGVPDVGSLNRAVFNKDIEEIMWVAEGFFEKQVVQVADKICALYPEKRIICIAGPSSSGKVKI